MKLWNHRLCPQIFSLLGGEPTLHPSLTEFISLSRKNWPNSDIRLATNGFFLHKHPNLPAVLKDSNAYVQLSIHHNSPQYDAQIRPVLELLDQWKEDGIRVAITNAIEFWTRRYHGYGSALLPFRDNDPRRSWENCHDHNYQLFEGKIWKCPPLAYLKLQAAKYRLSHEWETYLKYRPLDPSCTDKELNGFFDKEEEPYCRMCPANPEKFEPPLPFRIIPQSASA